MSNQDQGGQYNMSTLFEGINWEELGNEVAELEQNSEKREFKEVPLGKYEVKINKMEIRTAKSGNPMFYVLFKVLAGEYKNEYISMFQVITQSFQFKIVYDFLKSLDSKVMVDSKQIKSGDDFNNLIQEVYEVINGKLEYALEYGENKGFKTFKIVEVFSV
jgi:hypothetical protein